MDLEELLSNALRTGFGPISTNSLIPKFKACVTHSFQSTGDESCFPTLSKMASFESIYFSQIHRKVKLATRPNSKEQGKADPSHRMFAHSFPIHRKRSLKDCCEMGISHSSKRHVLSFLPLIALKPAVNAAAEHVPRWLQFVMERWDWWPRRDPYVAWWAARLPFEWSIEEWKARQPYHNPSFGMQRLLNQLVFSMSYVSHFGTRMSAQSCSERDEAA